MGKVGKLDVWAPYKPADIDRWRRMSACPPVRLYNTSDKEAWYGFAEQYGYCRWNMAYVLARATQM